MASKHTSGEGRKEFSKSLLDLNGCQGNGWCDEEPGNQTLWPRHLARKWILTLFVGTSLLYSARMAMPICIVSLAAEFHWSKVNSALVLGGFFWGYCLTQILGGHASDKIGGERVLFLSATSWSLVTAGTPLLVYLGSHTLYLMTMARFLMGVLQGVFYPSLASLCSKRVVEGERGFLMSTMLSGTHLGTLLAGGIGTLLLEQYGWESVFYTTGFLSGMWALVVWLVFLRVYALPLSYMDWRSAPTDALDTIGSKAGDTAVKQRMLSVKSQQSWLAFWLIKRPCVWAMVFAHMCTNSTSYTLLSWLPTYFKESFPHAQGVLYNVVPWFTAIPAALIGGCASDFLISQGYSVVLVRKLMQFISMGISSMFLLPLCGQVTFSSALFFVSAATGLNTFSSSGVAVNVQDLTQSCAGALYGFMNMMGAFMGVVLVSLSGYLIEVTQSWATIFSLVVLVNTTGLLVFLFFGDAKRVDLEHHSQVIVI